MLEPDLFDEDNNLPGPSMEGGIVVEGGVEGDEDGNEGENAEEDDDDEEESDEEADDDNQNANAEIAIIQVSERGECYGDEVDDDDANLYDGSGTSLHGQSPTPHPTTAVEIVSLKLLICDLLIAITSLHLIY
jgi:hypothetical protein